MAMIRKNVVPLAFEAAVRSTTKAARTRVGAADRLRMPQAFWRAIEHLGLHPAAVLEKAGLPSTLPHDPGIPLTTDEMFAIWQALETTTADPAFSLKLLRTFDSSGHQPAYLAANYASTYRESLTALDRFTRLGACEKFVLHEADGQASIQRLWPFATRPEPFVSVELSLAFWVDLGRRGTGREIVPIRIELARPERVADDLSDYFKCPIEYGKKCNRLVLHSIDLDRLVVARNPEFLRILTPALLTSLDAGVPEYAADQKQSLEEQIKRAIKSSLPSGRPELGDVAHALGMSERTLQRRITEEGKTFRTLLTESRQELGRQLVSNSSVEVDEVAFLLGYQDTSSFYRAFKEWEGMTPGQWRAETLKICTNSASDTPV